MNRELLEQYLQSQEYLKLIAEKIKFEDESDDVVIRAKYYKLFSENIWEFATKCLLVFEPRSSDKNLIFNPFPHQAELLVKLDEFYYGKGGDLYVEKSRDLGITYTVLAWIFHKWLFEDNFVALIGSRKEDEVDNKMVNSLFGKLRYFLYHLPAWLQPKGFKKKLHDNHMKLINPERYSFIEGESANENMFRGKRGNVIFIDEALFVPNFDKVLNAVYDAATFRIYVSTPDENAFAKRWSDNLRKQGRVVSLHWSSHPFKDKEWYEKELQLRQASGKAIMSELELSYDISFEDRYYPEAYECLTEPLEYKNNLPLFLAIDTGTYTDYSALIWAQKDGEKLYVLDAIVSHGKLMPNKFLIDWFLPFMSKEFDIEDTNWYNSSELELLKRVRSWKNPDMICAEPAQKAHQQGWGYSVIEYIQTKFKDKGIKIFIATNDLYNTHKGRREAVSRFLKNTIFNSNSEGALKVLDALKNTKKLIRQGTTDDKIIPEKVSGEGDLRAAFENLCGVLMTQMGGIRVIQYAR